MKQDFVAQSLVPHTNALQCENALTGQPLSLFAPFGIKTGAPRRIPFTTKLRSVMLSFPTSLLTTILCLGAASAFDADLSKLDLVSFAGFQSASDGVLSTGSGSTYSIAELKPYTALFAPDSFEISADETVAIHKTTGQEYPIAVFRAVASDETILQVVRDPEGSITYGEIRGPKVAEDTFFLPTELTAGRLRSEGFDEKDSSVLMSFTTADIDREKLAENFDFGEAPPIPAEERHIQFSDTTASLEFGNRKLMTCRSFQVVPVALVYDSKLCGVYGSKQATEQRLMTIAASASALYERQMCVQLQLTDIHTPDRNCGGDSPTFGDFFFSNACGGTESLLDDFTTWARSERGSIGVNADSLLHLFTGVSRPTNSRTIGCAWIGVVRCKYAVVTGASFNSPYRLQLCLRNWSVGVEYLTFSSSIVSQTLVFAHEIGHNLNAQHMPDPQREFNYIMEASISTGADGFSADSINTITSFLNSPSVRCDSTAGAPSNPAPVPRPTPRPTRRPTPRPTRRPTPRPTPHPTRRPQANPPAPVQAPVPQPTRRPLAPPIPADIGPTPTPGGCPVPPEWSLCLVKPAEESLYSCFPLEEVLPQTCPSRGITFEVTRCDGLAVNRRQLKRQGSSSDSGDDTETTIFTRSGTTAFDNSTGIDSSAATTSLRLPDCTRACVIVNDDICFHGVHGNHFVSFYAINRRGERVGNLNRRRVAGYTRDFGGCRSATVQCRET